MEQSLPSGTLTLLVSDIEDSTRLVSQLGVQYGAALSVQRSILREEFRRRHGREMGTAGDSFFVVFTSAGDAVRGVGGSTQACLVQLAWGRGRTRLGGRTAV